MRLIDADELKKAFVGKRYGTKAIEYVIDNAPTVEAIHIWWLHSIMEKQLIFAMESEMEGTTTVQDGVIHCVSGALACQVLSNVIKLWEKENGVKETGQH